MKVTFDYDVSQKFLRENLDVQLKYFFPSIQVIDFGESVLHIESKGEMEENAVREQIERILQKFDKLKRLNQQKVWYDSADDALRADWQESLQNLNQVALNKAATEFVRLLQQASSLGGKGVLTKQQVEVRRGLNVYANESALMFDALNQFFKIYFEQAYGAQDLKIPAMISRDTVDRAGYFETACQHLSFVGPITNDPQRFSQFASFWEKAKAQNDYTGLHDFLKEPYDVLNPALCLHCYPLFEQQEFASDDLVALTVYGSCFRDESGNLNNGERLNEFSMREAVFFGNDAKLKSIHAEVTAFAIWVGEFLGLSFTLANAYDIFFNEQADKQLFSQLVTDNKLELIANHTSAGKSFSVASINKHHTHFASRFDINDTEQQPISTMCIGFGLNRIIYALQDRMTSGYTAFVDELAAQVAKLQAEGVAIL